MKQLALFVFMFAVATQAQAGTHRTFACERLETDAECINRVVKNHPAVKLIFHTGTRADRPEYLHAIYSNSPEVEMTIEHLEGDTLRQSFIAVFPVEAKQGTSIKHVAFNIRMEKQIERVDGYRQVVGRTIGQSQVDLLGVSED